MALETSDPDDLTGYFQDGLNSDHFDKLRNLVARLNPVKAISLGVMGNADLFVGVQGAFGYAADLHNFDETSAIFGGGGLIEGVDAAFEGSIGVGIWLEATADIGGLYIGAEVDIDEGMGVTALAYASHDDNDKFRDEDGVNLDFAKVIMIGLDVGLGDGVAADESYFFAGHITKYPSFQTDTAKHQVNLTTLHCGKQDARDNAHDSVTLVWRVDGGTQQYGYPIWNDIQMRSTPNSDIFQVPLGTVIKSDESFEIDLHVNGHMVKTHRWHDYDFKGPGDVQTKTFSNDDCSYDFGARLQF